MRLLQEPGHRKVDCPKAKDKKKESKTEANLAQVICLKVVLHRQMDQTQTHQYSLSSLLPLLLVI